MQFPTNKKLNGRSEVATTDPGPIATNSRLFIIDLSTKLQFLVDSGAAVSVLPSTFKAVNAIPSKYKLYAANSSIINTYGQKLLSLNFGLRRQFRWAFIIADVDKPIIGADFIEHFGLLIDLKNRKLIDSLTQLKTTAEIYNGPTTQITTVCPDSAFDNLLCEFQDIYQRQGCQTQRYSPHLYKGTTSVFQASSSTGR